MIIAIVIPTYYRKDGSTFELLTRALQSIKNQKYNNYHVFLIGDRYENNSEFEHLATSIISDDQITYINLNVAEERDNYNDKYALWSYGGVNATNIGIKLALNIGYKYICHLDHDDWWYDDHLSLINDCIESTNCDWVCTKSTFAHKNRYLPTINTNENIVSFLPVAAGLIHSSTCVNFKTIPLLYRDIYKETGSVGQPSDADLWIRMGEYIKNNNLKSYHINKLTCRHDEEGFEKR